jgi:imidazolonepropionase-like amidohydrolase
MVLAIKGKQVIDATGGAPIVGGVVLVEGEKIAAVGTADQLRIPANAERIDLPEDTILPGLVDAHSHVVLREKGGTAAEQHLQPDPVTALRGAKNVREDLLSGVTTMRTMSDRNFVDVAMRQAIQEGEVAGPRLVVATRGIRTTHGWGSSGVTVDGPEEVRKAVRTNLQFGADLTKLMITSRAGPDPAKFQLGAFYLEPTLTREEIAVAIYETHNMGKPVAAHCHGGLGLRWAVEEGLDTVEHAGQLSDDDVDLIIKKGTTIVWTLTVVFDKSGLEGMEAWKDTEFREQLLARRERLKRLVPMAAKAGAKWTVGSDARHGRFALEMAYLVDFGISPTDAILAGTIRAAETLRMADKIGSLEKGKLADIISVRGDPLQDITALQRVNLIMKGGVRSDLLSAY